MRFSRPKRFHLSPWEWAALIAGISGIFSTLWYRHHHHHRKIYVSGTILGLALITSALMSSARGTDVLQIAAVNCGSTPENACLYQTSGNQTDRPWKCSNGVLVEDNQVCGCPTNSYPWTDGSCTRLPQLKTYNQFIPYCVADPGSSSANCPSYTDLSWIADHIDITGAHAHQRAALKQSNPSVKISSYVLLQSFQVGEVKSGFPNYCAANGCSDMEEAYLHFVEDTQMPTRTQGYVCRPGYNPSNRPAGWLDTNPGCITTASDHYSRATSSAASRVNDGYLPGWRWINFSSTDWLNYTRYKTVNLMNYGGVESDYLFSDNSDFKPMNSNLDYTVEYNGIPTDVANASSHPRVQEIFDQQVNLRAYVSNYFQRKKEFIVNSIEPANYLVYSWLHTRYQNFNPINYFQLWEVYENAIGAPTGGAGRAHTYDDYLRSKTILQESLQGGYRFVLSGYNYASSEVARSKKFLTSYYYLLNNKNLIYEYYDATSEQPPYGQNPDTNNVSIRSWGWTPLLDYNIGRPVTIPAGKTDVFGAAAASGTTEHYLFATGIDPSTTNSARTFTSDSNCKTGGGQAIQKNYYIFARNYAKALVLTKFRQYCGFTDPSSATTHQLGGTYYQLKDDGTVDTTPITSITLKNQEGAILIPAAVVASCPEDWTCSDWSACSANQQSRQCWDLNTCGTFANQPSLTQSCGQTVCDENWDCTNWGACSNGQQSRSCTDLAHCGTTVNKPALTQSCTSGGGGGGGGTPPASCSENWSCKSWSACVNSNQTRTCTDLNSCGTTKSKPALSQSCSATNCATNYVCEPWSGCKANGTQTRLCADQNNCAGSTTRLEARDCIDEAPDSTAPDTTITGLGSTINTDHVTVTLNGTDNKSAVAALKFDYQLDEGATALSGVTLNLRNLTNGAHKLTVWAIDEAGNKDLTPAVANFTVNASIQIVTIPQSGGASLFRVFDDQGRLISQFNPFPAWHRWGGSVAIGDVDNNGTRDIVVAPGRGGKPQVAWYDTKGKKLGSFMAYPDNFIGGVNVAVADLDGDGTNEIIAAPATGTGPLLRVFKSNGEIIAETAAFDRAFRGGVNIAAGTVDTSGKAYVFAAQASNGSGEVNKFELQNKALVRVASGAAITGSMSVGLSLAIVRVESVSLAQIVATVTQGATGSDMAVLSPELVKQHSMYLGDKGFTGGYMLAGGDARNFDNVWEIITATVHNSRSRISIFSPGGSWSQGSSVKSFDPYGWSRFAVNVAVGYLN